MYISDHDVPIIPDGLVVSQTHVIDRKTDFTYPINGIAVFILQSIDHKKSVYNICEEISSYYSTSIKEVEQDVKNFLFQMNNKYLLNFKHKHFTYRVYLFFVNLIKFKMKIAFETISVRERIDLSSSEGIYVFFEFTKHILWSFKYSFFSIFLILWVLPLLQTMESLLVTASFIISVISHELSHVVAIKAVKESGKVAFFGKTFGTVGIFRRPLPPVKEIFVSISGPLIPSFIGISLMIYGLQSSNFLIFFISFFFISHLFSFFSSDGKNVISSIKRYRTVQSHQHH